MPFAYGEDEMKPMYDVLCKPRSLFFIALLEARGPVSIKCLARHFDYPKEHVHKLIKPFVVAGFIDKSIRNRYAYVSLTTRGEAVAVRLKECRDLLLDSP